MKPTTRTWIVRAGMSMLLVAVVAVSLSVVGMKAHEAKAASSTVVQLSSIRVSGDDYLSHASYHRGENILLWAYYSGSSVDGWVIVHPAMYHGTYRLLNFSTGMTLQSYESLWSVTIPKNAPTGTYKYWFTLSQSWGPDQTLMVPFNVIK